MRTEDDTDYWQGASIIVGAVATFVGVSIALLAYILYKVAV